jgi:hypothetical protein
MASVNGNQGNQRLYREVNKRIRKLAVATNGAIDFLCECGRDDCTATIEFTQPQFDAILRENDSVLIATEHADGIGGRRVLAENGRFLVVAAE